MSVGPVRLGVVGDQFKDACRIISILWVSRSSTSGDVAAVRDRDTSAVLWECVTDTTRTYLGMSFGTYGMPAPDGFRLSEISSGVVYVYLRET